MAADDALFVASAKFGKEIRLTRTIWRKIETQHPEFRGRSDYLAEIRNTVEDPDYIVQGWGKGYSPYAGVSWHRLDPSTCTLCIGNSTPTVL